eukprot:4390490-Pyramimonas_sp.AAC.1
MLDGAILRLHQSSLGALTEHLNAVGSKHNVSFSTDLFDRLGGAAGKNCVSKLKQCAFCGCSLKAPDKTALCTVVGSDAVTTAWASRKRCCSRNCGASFRPNFDWQQEKKCSVSSFEEIKARG